MIHDIKQRKFSGGFDNLVKTAVFYISGGSNMYLDLKAIGKRIREKRKLLGWSQEYLAECSNYSTQYIGNIERGQARASLEALVAIATALNITPDSLLRYNHHNSREHIYNEIDGILKAANENQLKVIADTLSILIKSWNEIEEKTC